MEERIEPYQVDAGNYPPVSPAALTAEVTAEIATALAGARHPLIVTSYLGRDPAAVPSLVELAELLAIPVLEAMAYHVNFPDDHPLHAGFQYHSTGQNPVLAEADVILVLDSDVPWIPSVNRPADAPRSTTSTSTRSSPRCSCGRCPRGGSPPRTRRSRWSRSPPSFGTMIWSTARGGGASRGGGRTAPARA